MLVPAFTGATTLPRGGAGSFDMEVASSKYLYGLPDGEVPLAFNFNGTVHYRGDDGRLQMSLVPWSCSAEFRLPVAIWREADRALLPAHRLDRRCTRRRSLALQREKARRGAADARRVRRGAARGARERRRAASSRCSTRATRSIRTRRARRRTRRRRRSASSIRPRTRARWRAPSTTSSSQCVAEGDGEVSAEVRFLVPSGERHQAEPQRARGRRRLRAAAACRSGRGSTACDAGRTAGGAGHVPGREPDARCPRARPRRARSAAR